MRDSQAWRAYVRQNLPPLPIAPEREAAIVEQIAGELQDRYDDAIAAGATEAEALAAAEAQIPSWNELAADLLKTERRVTPSQVMNRVEAAGDFGRDVIHLLRAARKAPLFYGAIVGILASTIGLSAVVFSAVYGIMLKPYPFAEMDRVVRVSEVTPEGNPFSVSVPNFLDWRDGNDVFDEIGAFQSAQVTLGDEERPERLQAARVSANFFPLLGLQPSLGRPFQAGEDEAGAPDVAILSDSLWQRRFQSNSAIVSQTVHLDGRPFLIAGILPPGFEFPSARSEFSDVAVEVLLPLKIDPSTRTQRGNHFLRVLARRKPGVSLQQAGESMRALAERIGQQNQYLKWSVLLQPLDSSILGENRRVLFLLLGAIGLVVLIGCANVANLLLARGAFRQREFAVRLSLGCGAPRLVRQMLTESVALAALGGALGLALASQGLRILMQLAPHDLPRIERVQMDATVLWFTFALCTITALCFGMAPAWQAVRTPPADAMRSGSKGAAGLGALRIESPLVILEVALTVVLLIGAGLLAKTLWRLERVDPGFRPDGVLTFRLRAAGAKYTTARERNQFFEAVIEKVRTMPGVSSASSTQVAPLVSGDTLLAFLREGQPLPPPGQRPDALVYSVMPDYFQTMGIPVRAGRDFDGRDRFFDPRVLIVNETLARKHFPGEDPVGQNLALDGNLHRIIAVVDDTLHYDLTGKAHEQVYVPVAQTPLSFTRVFVVRSHLPPEALTRAISREVFAIDPEIPVSNVVTMQDAVRATASRERTSAALMTIFAVLALTLAGAGVYAVIAYFVGRRVHELGLRAALGATSRDLFRFVLTRGMKLALSGLVLGLAVAAAGTSYLDSILFGVEPRDLSTFVVVALVILLACAAACGLPAWKAARVDPMAALREE